MGEIPTDSPYYEWASELVETMRANRSSTEMRVAEQIKEELPDFLDEVGWCADCERPTWDECGQRRPRYNEGRL